MVAVLASLVVLLVFDYTLHHAKIAAVMVLSFRRAVSGGQPGVLCWLRYWSGGDDRCAGKKIKAKPTTD